MTAIYTSVSAWLSQAKKRFRERNEVARTSVRSVAEERLDRLSASLGHGPKVNQPGGSWADPGGRAIP
jgi:hypothetical protein